MVSKTTNEQGGKSPWINAWTDTVAGVNCFSQLMALSDLKDDGDYKLVTADYKTNRLKVFMGTNVLYTADLSGKPTAV